MESSFKISEWKKLYDTMIEIKKIAPWQWLEETDLFAVQNPENNEIGFVSVMGAIGEHYSIAVYLGERGFHCFWDMQNCTVKDLLFQKLFETPQLQASFEDRQTLEEDEIKLINKIGLTFRGKASWPLFRSHHPGFLPWRLETAEARFLQHVLEQTIDVSLRVKSDRSLLKPDDLEVYLLRKRVRVKNDYVWQDALYETPQPEPIQIEFMEKMSAISKLKNMQPDKSSLEVDFFMMPAPIHEKGSRPYLPYVLMLVEQRNGMVLGTELLPPVPTLESLWGRVPAKVSEMLAKQKLLPGKLLVSSELLYQLLLQFCDKTGISLEHVKKLPNASQARTSFMSYMKRKK